MSNYEQAQDPNTMAGIAPRPPVPRPQFVAPQPGPPRPQQGGPLPQRPPAPPLTQPQQNYRPVPPNTIQPQPRPIPPGQINNIPPGQTNNIPPGGQVQRPPIHSGQVPLQRPPPPQNFNGQPVPQYATPQPQQGQLGPRGPPPIRNQAPPYPTNATTQPRPPAPPIGQISRQGSQAAINPQPIPVSQAAMDSEAIKQSRSYSIAGPPGALPTGPLHDEERRRSIASTLGGRSDEPLAQKPGLAFIKEGVAFDKKESPLNVGLTRLSKEDVTKGSRESVKSDSSDHRPESRLSGSKMTDSIMGSLDTDDRKNFSPKPSPSPNGMRYGDEVRASSVSPQQNGVQQMRGYGQENGHSVAPTTIDRSPSLTRTDSSPEQMKANLPVRPPSSLSKSPEQRDDAVKGKQEVLDRPGSRVGSKPTDFTTPFTGVDKKPVIRNFTSAQRIREGDNDSGVDEFTQGNDHMNGSPGSPGKKSPSKIPGLKMPSQPPSATGQRAVSSPSAKTPHTPNTPDSTTSNTSIDKHGKKVPMNKIQVGAAPTPNIRTAKSKIGSLENATHKPGGGKIKIENRKLEFGNVTPRIAAKNDAYAPGGGDKKITQKKLQWNAKSKIGSLENANHKPGGGDKKIESVKLDFKDKAKPKVASTVNITHKPGGGDVKSPIRKETKKDIENQKLEIKAQSKIGSLDNVKHKPGGGDKKIFEDKEYLKQISGKTPLSACEGFCDYMNMANMDYNKDSGPRSIINMEPPSNERPRRPRTAREPAVRSRYMSPRKCQTPRNVSAGVERPPFRCY